MHVSASLGEFRQGFVSPCDLCVAGCCRSFNLVIDGFDAYRLGRSLKLRLADFADLRWAEAADDEHRIVLGAGQGRYYRMVLIRLPDAHPGHPLRCIFLLNVGDRARCGVYDLRPSMCRTYPSHLADGLIATTGGKFCPPNAWRVETMNVPYFRVQHQFKAQQRVIYDRVVDRWNERVAGHEQTRTAGDFFDYLINLYSLLEVRHPALFTEPTNVDAPLPSPEELRGAVDEAAASTGWQV